MNRRHSKPRPLDVLGEKFVFFGDVQELLALSVAAHLSGRTANEFRAGSVLIGGSGVRVGFESVHAEDLSRKQLKMS
jgi:hypothetical protein